MQQRQVDAEAGVGGFGAGDRLEHQVHRRALLDGLDLVGHVRQHAGLGGDLEALDDLVHAVHQGLQRAQAVAGRVDADDRIARAQQQAVEQRGGDAARVVGGVVGLQAHGQPARQAHGVAKAGDDPAFAGHQDQVLLAHQLAHRGHHLGGQPGANAGQRGFVRAIAQQPVAEITHGQVADLGEGGGVVAVDDQPGDFIVLVGDHRFKQEGFQRQIGQCHAGRHALGRGAGGHAGQHIARAQRRGTGEQGFQVRKVPDLPAQGVLMTHGVSVSGRRAGRGDLSPKPVPPRRRRRAGWRC